MSTCSEKYDKCMKDMITEAETVVEGRRFSEKEKEEIRKKLRKGYSDCTATYKGCEREAGNTPAPSSAAARSRSPTSEEGEEDLATKAVLKQHYAKYPTGPELRRKMRLAALKKGTGGGGYKKRKRSKKKRRRRSKTRRKSKSSRRTRRRRKSKSRR